MLCASAVLTLGFLTIAEAQPGRGGGRGGPGGGGGFGGRGIGGPGIGGPGFGQPGIGIQFGNNPGFNNGWNQWGTPGIYYGGNNFGLWYSPYSTWNVPMSTRGAYGTVVPATTGVTTTTVVPANAVATSQYGLQVTRVFEGGAKKADLRSGDVILGIGKTRTESFEALQAALVGAKEVEIVFFNNESKKVEKLPVKVDDGKIGVEVVPVVMQ
jgi:hypothetical protein